MNPLYVCSIPNLDAWVVGNVRPKGDLGVKWVARWQAQAL